MKTRLAIAVAALPFLVAASCPKPAPTPGAKQSITAGGYDVEIASAAVVRSDKCADGRLTVASWGSLFNGPLDGSAPFTDVTSQLYDAYPPAPDRPWEWGGDPLLARLPNGDLLFSRQGNVGNMVELPGPLDLDATVMTGIQWFWISDDCGQTWKAHSTIEALKVFNGDCAIPRFDAKGNIQASGWDRGELAVDPWSGRAYFATDCDSGAPEGKGFTGRLFILEPGATQWTPSPVILPRYPPAVMTVTQSGALWLFHCVDDKPMLYRSTDHGQSFPTKVQVNTALPGGAPACGSVINATPERQAEIGIPGSEELAGHQEVLVWDYGLSRVGPESVRIVYPTLAGGRARLVAVTGNWKTGSEEMSFLPLVHTFTQTTGDGSEIHPTFIDPDDIGPEKSPNTTSVLYWLESSPAANEVRVRYSVARAGINYGPAQTIADPWTPKLEPALPIGNWAGDYQNGAYYCKDGKMHFVLVWPESDATVSTPNYGIHFATVTLTRIAKSVQPREKETGEGFPHDLRHARPLVPSSRLFIPRHRSVCAGRRCKRACDLRPVTPEASRRPPHPFFVIANTTGLPSPMVWI